MRPILFLAGPMLIVILSLGRIGCSPVGQQPDTDAFQLRDRSLGSHSWLLRHTGREALGWPWEKTGKEDWQGGVVGGTQDELRPGLSRH